MFQDHPDRCFLSPPVRGLLVRQMNLHDGSARPAVLYQAKAVTAATLAARDAALAAALADVPYRHVLESWQDGVGRRWVGQIEPAVEGVEVRYDEATDYWYTRTDAAADWSLFSGPYRRVTKEWEAPPPPNDPRWLTRRENGERRRAHAAREAQHHLTSRVRHFEQFAAQAGFAKGENAELHARVRRAMTDGVTRYAHHREGRKTIGNLQHKHLPMIAGAAERAATEEAAHRAAADGILAELATVTVPVVLTRAYEVE